MTLLGNDGLANRTPDQSLIVGDQGAMRGGKQSALYSDRIQAILDQAKTFALVYSANARIVTALPQPLASDRRR